MDMYGLNATLFDLGFSDSTLIESLSSSHRTITDRRRGESEKENLLKLSNSILKNMKKNSSPPKHRHDGTSPLPLGMDWNPPPRNWMLDGKNTIWPLHTGWSYCVKVPSSSSFAESIGSKPVVFYRVQIGLQSPKGVTTTHGVFRRFSDFLNLSSDLKRCFHNKKLPSAPPKGLLRMTDRRHIEERRCSLEDWMEKVLSDIDFSRSALVACFLELEVAARSAFHESSHQIPNVNLSCNSISSSDPLSSQTDVSVVAGTTALALGYDGFPYQTSDIQSDLYVKDNSSEVDRGNLVCGNDFAGLTKATVNEAFSENKKSTLSEEFSGGKEEKLLQKSLYEGINLDQIHMHPSYDRVKNSHGLKPSPVISHAKGLLRESPTKGTSSAPPNEIFTPGEVHQDGSTSSKCSGSVETSEALEMLGILDLQFSPDTLVVLPSDGQQKMNRLLSTVQQRLVTSRTDIEDLIARLNQELAVRQYLTAKVKDLETEVESTKHISEEKLEQAIYIERERFIQIQWDMEELSRKCMETEHRLKIEQDEKARAEATKTKIIKENESLRQELDSAREQLMNLQKFQVEVDLKSKSDVKLLVREVKSLQSSRSELEKKLDRVSKEKEEFETILRKERTKSECVDASNRKLLHECEVLGGRLEECSVNFPTEQENKQNMEFPPDALDILATSDNRIALLLAEAQLLAQNIATPVAGSSHENDNSMTMDDKLRKMLTDVLIDNASLRKHANSLIRCALNMAEAP